MKLERLTSRAVSDEETRRTMKRSHDWHGILIHPERAKESYDKSGHLNELWPTDDNRNGVGRRGVLMAISLKLLWNLDCYRMKSKNKMEQNNNKKLVRFMEIQVVDILRITFWIIIIVTLIKRYIELKCYYIVITLCHSYAVLYLILMRETSNQPCS